MKRITLKIIAILIIANCLYAVSDSMQDDIIQFIQSDVSKYFIKHYKIQPEDIEVNFKRLPAEIEKDFDYNFKFTNSFKDYKPGYQTIWIELYKANMFKMKFPVSFDISIRKTVAVTKKKIKRGQALNSDLVELKKVEINMQPDRLFDSLEELSVFESSRFIKSGTVLTMKMVRIPPALKKGDNVEIRLSAGNLFISTSGVAKEDGHLGDEIRVICQRSKRKLKGIIQAPNLVLITSNGY